MSKKVVGNAASLISMQAVGYILPLVTVPYLVRVLGPDHFGLVAFSQALMGYFVTFTDYGFNLSATRELAICRHDRKLRSELYSSIGTLKAILCLFSFLCVWLIVLSTPRFHANAAVFYASFLAVVGNCLFPAWFFQGIEKLYWISVINFMANLAFTVSIFVFVHSSGDFVMTALLQSGGRVLAGILGVIILFTSEGLRISCPRVQQLRRRLIDGWHVFVSQVSVSLFISSITVCLGLLRGMEEVGYFSAANKVLSAGQAVMAAIGQAMYPHVCSIAAQSRARAIAYLRKAMLYISIISMAGGIAILLFAGPVVRIAMGSHYSATVPILRAMALIPFICGINNIYGTQAMLNFGMKREFTLTIMLSGLICFALLFPLALAFGGFGCAIVALVFEFVQTAAFGVILHKRGVQIIGCAQLAV